MLRLLMPQALTLAVDILAWGAFHTAAGYAAHRLDESRLHSDGWLLRPRSFETPERYRHRLRIHRWKDTLPEAGALFPGGVSKRHLGGAGAADLEAFARETRRGELAHWWAMACGPVFLLWNPPLAAAVLVGYGVVANLPFILIQRYNRVRIQSLIERLPVSRSGPART